MKGSATITIPSHPKYLSVVRAVTTRMGELSGMTDTATENITLAVDEACSNVIKYAYNGNTAKKIMVRFITTRESFEVVIEDNGIKAKPEAIEGRNLNDVRPGGLGMHLIRRAFDIFAFDQTKKTGNRLRLVRHVKGERWK